MTKDKNGTQTYFFAYGSLKKGYFFGHLMDKHQFMGEALLEGSYQMFLHPDGFPYIIPSKSADKQVHGELYRLTSNDVIADLDLLEGHPGEYTRTDCTVKASNNHRYNAFVYVFNAKQSFHGSLLIPKAKYIEDKSTDEHRLKIIKEHGLEQFLKR